MERELWRLLYAATLRLDKPWGGWKYSDAEILAVYFWAVVHDRPTCWAARPEHWPNDLRPRRLPPQSTLSRRLRRPAVVRLMNDVEDDWFAAACTTLVWVRIIDAKPLVVGGVSKDRDAGFGRAARGFARGYKFYAVWGGGPLPVAWALAPMNVSEKQMARRLIPELPDGGCLLADGEYDSNDLYDLAAAARFQLLAPKRRGRGLGHRRQSPARLRSIRILRTKDGRELWARRRQIERDFAGLTNFGGGLAPLPAWVRRFPRVRNWLHAKLLVNAARWLRKHPQALA